MTGERYTILYAPEARHICPLPEANYHYRGVVARCDECGQVSKCVVGDYWYWKPLSRRALRRLEKERGIV